MKINKKKHSELEINRGKNRGILAKSLVQELFIIKYKPRILKEVF